MPYEHQLQIQLRRSLPAHGVHSPSKRSSTLKRCASQGLELLSLEDGFNGVAFSPDGRFIASATREGSVRIWNAAEVNSDESGITHRCRVDATSAPAEFPLNRRRLKDSACHARIIGENTDPFCPEISHEVIEGHFSPGKLAVVWINVDEEEEIYDLADRMRGPGCEENLCTMMQFLVRFLIRSAPGFRIGE